MINKGNLQNIIHCGIGFFLVFMSFITWQNIVAEAFDQKHYDSLGFLTVGLIYISYAIASLIFPFIIDKLGSRYSMSLGAFFYFSWVLSGILPVWIEKTPFIEIIVWIIMMLTGVINGIGACLLWVGEGKYVSQWWTEENKGLYFSMIWLFCSLSSVFGNLFGKIFE